MKHTITLFFAFCLLFVFFLGCGGGKEVPPGFPAKLTPTTVTLLKDGQPVAEAAVSLISEPPTPYLISAMTDAAGVAKLQTTINAYSAAGAPAGSYKILISKQVQFPEDNETDEALRDQRKAQTDKEKADLLKASGILPDWSNIEKTPFKLTVPAEEKSFTIDVSDSGTFVQ